VHCHAHVTGNDAAWKPPAQGQSARDCEGAAGVRRECGSKVDLTWLVSHQSTLGRPVSPAEHSTRVGLCSSSSASISWRFLPRHTPVKKTWRVQVWLILSPRPQPQEPTLSTTGINPRVRDTTHSRRDFARTSFLPCSFSSLATPPQKRNQLTTPGAPLTESSPLARARGRRMLPRIPRA
jgi:hypothetical protein